MPLNITMAMGNSQLAFLAKYREKIVPYRCQLDSSFLSIPFSTTSEAYTHIDIRFHTPSHSHKYIHA